MPTFDWAAFTQRVFAFISRAMLFRLLLGFLGTAFNLFKTPLFLGAMVIALTYFPDTIQWIFMKIGEIEMKMFMIVLSSVLPDVFTFGSGEVNSWADIWNQGLNLLPSDMLEVMNGIGVAELLGLTTSTLMAGSQIALYRKIMTRAGLM